MSTFNAIILDSEGAELVGLTTYDGDPGYPLRLAIPPRPISWRTASLDPVAPLDVLIVEARCERQRGDGVYIFRRVEDFR